MTAIREGSLLDDDTWSDADVVFVSSLCFSEQLLQVSVAVIFIFLFAKKEIIAG